MKDTVTVNNVAMTYAQIEAAHAEMMRQKAGIEFKEGDIVLLDNEPKYIAFAVSDRHDSDTRKKITGTPEFMAQLRAVLEGE